VKPRAHHYVIPVLALMALLLAACAQGEPLVVKETVEVVKEVTVIDRVTAFGKELRYRADSRDPIQL
jgi:hypothetical protein